MISRRLTQITNPWQELTPGTGLIVNGKKAVIRRQPEAPPATKQTGLRVKLTVEEIAGTTMTLEWEQQLHNLNAAETAPARAVKVQVKGSTPGGHYLVLSGNRVIVSKRQIAYNSPTSTANKDLTIAANYYKLIGGRGQLTGTPAAVACRQGVESPRRRTTPRAKHRPVGDLEIPRARQRSEFNSHHHRAPSHSRRTGQSRDA